MGQGQDGGQEKDRQEEVDADEHRPVQQQGQRHRRGQVGDGQLGAVGQQAAHPDALIIFGAAFDDTLEDEIRVTVIATGFEEREGAMPSKPFTAAGEKKAEAQKRMGEASILEMYLAALPEVVKNAAAPLAQTEKIVMYGDGNSTKLIKDVIASTNQIADGMRESTGIDLQALIAGFAGGKAAQKSEPVEVG